MNASNSALFPRTQEDSSAHITANMSSTPSQPLHEGVSTPNEQAELEAEIARLHKVVSKQSARIIYLDCDATVQVNRIRALDDRLLSSECERLQLKEHLMEFEQLKTWIQRFTEIPVNNADDVCREFDKVSVFLRASENERDRLDGCLAFTNENHVKEVEELKKAASEADKACWALTKYYHDENTEKLVAQQRADAMEESMALELERLKKEVAASKETNEDLHVSIAKDWDAVWSKYNQEVRDREAAERKAERLDKQLDQWLAHNEGQDEAHHKALNDQDTWHAEEMTKLKGSYKEKRKEALADLKEEYEKKNAALLARNTGLEVQVSQLQEEAKLQQAAISSLGHRHSIAKEALNKEMEQVKEFRDKFFQKVDECAKLIQQHNVDLRVEKRNSGDAASKAEEETKKYIGVAESRADGLVKEKEELKARLASTNERLTNVYQAYKALQSRYSNDLEKEQDGRAQERKMAEASLERWRARLKAWKDQEVWTLAKEVARLEKELEVQKKGDFGIEALDDDADMESRSEG